MTMNFTLQPLYIIEQPAESTVKPKAKFACELPTFEPGYNLDDTGSCTISAQDDWSATIHFLNLYSSHHTMRSYALEVEKFLLWLLIVARMPLSGLKRDDWSLYIEFLQKVPPEFAGERQVRFLDDGSPNRNWRPFFSGSLPLSENSIRKAVKIIEALFAFLVEAKYFKASPVLSRRNRKTTLEERALEIAERHIPADLLDSAIDTLSQAAEKAKQLSQVRFAKKLTRSKFVIQFLRDTGLRADELVKVLYGHFSIETGSWSLKVVGKGQKARKIKIPSRLSSTIVEHRISIGLAPYPLYNEELPVFASFAGGGKPMTTRRLGQIIKESFVLVAECYKNYAANLNPASNEYGEALRNASMFALVSPHWLRHSHATEHLKEAGNLVATMKRLGHSDLSTTTLYLHDDDGSY